MKQLLLYKDVAALSPEHQGHWKARVAQDFRFAAGTNSVPLLLPEIPDAAREFPVAFVKTGDNAFVLACLLGLREDENLYVDPDTGRWGGRYLPAFIRRYPFLLSETPAREFIVCFDQAATDLIGPDIEGEALFTAGQPSAHTRQIMGFLDTFRVQAEESARWAKQMNDLGLLEAVSADARMTNGERYVLNGIYMVSEKKLHELPAVEIQSLFARGDLARIHAHLLSLGHFPRLVEQLAAHSRKAPDVSKTELH